MLRLDKQRLSLHGVLSVDKNGRLSITPKSNKNATTGKIEGKKANVVQGKRLEWNVIAIDTETGRKVGSVSTMGDLIKRDEKK